MKSLKILVERITVTDYCIGHLYLDGKYFCDTIEPPYTGTKQTDDVSIIKAKKIGNTAIPVGTYKILMNQISPKFKSRAWAANNKGIVPRYEKVPGFEGVLIHPGNIARRNGGDSSGCLLVGENKVKGQVVNSVNTYYKLFDILKKYDNITIEIKLKNGL